MDTIFLRRKSGQTIIGVLIAGALLLIAMLGLIRLVQTGLRSQRYLQEGSSFRGLDGLIRIIVENPKLCAKALYASEGHGTGESPRMAFFHPEKEIPTAKRLATLKLGDQVVATVGGSYDGLPIQSMSLTEVVRDARTVVPGGTVYLVSLLVRSQRDDKRGFTGALLSTTHTFYLKTDSVTDQIVACGAHIIDVAGTAGVSRRFVSQNGPNEHNDLAIARCASHEKVVGGYCQCHGGGTWAIGIHANEWICGCSLNPAHVAATAYCEPR